MTDTWKRRLESHSIGMICVKSTEWPFPDEIVTSSLFALLAELSEEWATSLKDLSENGDDELDCEQDTEIFQAKYLGESSIRAPRSVEATAEAVKSIISTAKG